MHAAKGVATKEWVDRTWRRKGMSQNAFVAWLGRVSNEAGMQSNDVSEQKDIGCGYGERNGG